MDLITVELVRAVMLLRDDTLTKCHGSSEIISVCVEVLEADLINIKVSLSGFGTCYIEGRTVLSHIVEGSFHLKHSNYSMIQLLLHHRNDISTVSVCDLSRNTSINEYSQSKPASFPGLTLEVIKVPLVSHLTKDLPSALYRQLHLYHIINPQMSYLLQVSLSPTETIQYSFEEGKPCLSIHSSSFKLLSSIEHYLDTRLIATSQAKLKVLRGVTCTIPCCLSNGIDLKLYSCVSVLPQLRLDRGRKVPADRVCNILHITVFTSGDIPLIPSGEHANFSLEDIALWSDYGIVIGPPVVTHSLPQSEGVCTCVPSYSFQLKPIGNSSLKNDRIIHLFLFIEPVVNDQWMDHRITLTSELTANFASLVKSHAKKFHRTCHSALNKILCNYSAFRKITTSVSTSLPLLAEAVTNIIRLSTSEVFKTEASLFLKTNDAEQNHQAVLLDRLKELAKKHKRIADRGPEEPTTPELLIATQQSVTETESITKLEQYVPLLCKEDSNFDFLTKLTTTEDISSEATQLCYAPTDEQVVPQCEELYSDCEWESDLVLISPLPAPLEEDKDSCCLQSIDSPPVTDLDFTWD